MKSRTLAGIALQHIYNEEFIFKNDEYRSEAIKQLTRIYNLNHSGELEAENNVNDPIVELQMGINVPNFDYPIIPTNSWGEIIICEENEKYIIPDTTQKYILKGKSINGEKYYMNNVYNFLPFHSCILKVDRYTNLKRAACIFVDNLCQILDKRNVCDDILRREIDVLKEKYYDIVKCEADKEKQRKLYFKWLVEFRKVYTTAPNGYFRLLQK